MFSLKTMELLENGLQGHSGATPPGWGAEKHEVYAATFGEHLFMTYFYRDGVGGGPSLSLSVNRRLFRHIWSNDNSASLGYESVLRSEPCLWCKMMYTQNTQKKVTRDTKRKGSPGNRTVWLLGRDCHGDLLVAREWLSWLFTGCCVGPVVVGCNIIWCSTWSDSRRHSSLVYVFVNTCI